MMFGRWFWPSVAAAWGGFLMAPVALAAVGATPRGPGWQDVALGALGLVSLLLGAHGARIEKRQDRTDGRIDNADVRITTMRLELAREHFTKAEAKEEYAKLERSLSALHRRLDGLGVPHVPRPTE